MESVVEARNIGKSYGEKVAVDGLHFSIQKKECFGILGPNGAGKTTTMRMLYGNSPLSKGELFVLGMNARKNMKVIKSRIGVVSQEDGLDPDFTVLDNLVVYARYFGISKKDATAKARELIRLMHLEEYNYAQVDTLSGGMKRRLSIARALMTDPELLFLDEPTTGLDPQARLWIWGVLRQLKSKGITLVLTTHYMEEAEQLCDRLIIIDKGKILCEGEPRELIQGNVGHEVVEFQVEATDVEYHLKRVRDRYEYQLLNNRIRIFLPESIEARIVLQELASDNFVVRRASLDDVFLKVAGYGLRPGS